MKATFVLPKDPFHESTGDLTMAKLVMELARESYEVGVICLSHRVESTLGGYRRVAKPAPKPLAILLESLRSRRSLVHSRFVIDDLVEAVDAADTDIFVADHSYTAESVLQSRRVTESPGAQSILAISTVVPEAMVWKATRGLLGQADAKRIVRDEIRVARAAYSVGTYDLSEAEFYRGIGHPRAHWLDLTLPAKEPAPVADTGPRLAFVGDRTWAPNQEAYETITRWWPRIAAGIEGANLCIVGRADPGAKPVILPDGATDLGFVDDLEGFLRSCRAVAAPIATGGGVRVKILDAACRGLPIVGTSAAVGSLDSVLGIGCIDDEQGFVDACRRYLLDRSAAAADGAELYRKNADRWRDGKPHEAVQDWLKS